MELERAIEILNPEHREQYDGIETVNEACRMGMEALQEKLDAQNIITAAQKEMTIYETAVDKWGKEGTARAAAVCCNKLAEMLFAIANSEKETDALTEARAETEIAMNLLSVLFGDCADAECVKLEALLDMVGE